MGHFLVVCTCLFVVRFILFISFEVLLEQAREIVYVLFHSSNGYNSQMQPGEPRASFRFSMWIQAFGVILYCLPRPVSRELNQM